MKRNSALYLTRGALIAALYVALSMLSETLGLCSGAIQCRFSEALTILPAFLAESIPGLYVGCFITNIIAGSNPWDIAFGPVATLIAAVATHLIGRAVRRAYAQKPFKFTVSRVVLLTAMFAIPPILSNAIIIPPILKFAYGLSDAMWFLVLTVAAGEIISCGVIGGILLMALMNNRTTRAMLLPPAKTSSESPKPVAAVSEAE